MGKKLIKMAYKMPPQQNWNAFRDPLQTNPNYITEEHYNRIVEAGFTHGMGLLEHGADVAVLALETAQKCGLKYYVRDEINWANILHKDFYYLNAENYKKYMQYDSFAGVYIHDEPNASKYPELGGMVKGYHEFFKGVGEPLVNLLPTYASHVEQLGAASYEDYILGYIQSVPTDYVMYDHYPFRFRESGEVVLHTDYLYNVSAVAKLCKEHGKELRTFVQSCNTDRFSGELPSEMLYFQIHTNLAHGSRAIVYYYYWGDMEDLGHHGLVDAQGDPQPIYYGAKKIHAQLLAYEDALMESAWQKTLYVKGSAAHHNQTDFARFENSVCEKDGEAEFSSEYDAIVGVFDYKGKKAYYAVNYTHPGLGLKNKISFRLSGNYDVYHDGECFAVDKAGKMILNVGCGAFFLPKE